VIEAQPPAKPAPAAAIAPATVPSQLASPPPAVSPSAPAQSAPAQPVPARINTGLVTIESDLQRADQATGVITATGNVRIVYPDQRVVATSRQAQYFSKEGRVVLSGAVDIVQEGGNLLRAEKVVYLVDSERLMAVPPEGQQVFSRMRINAVQPEAAPQAQAGTTPPSSSPASGSPASGSLTPSGRPVFPLSPAIPPSSLPGGQP
jgi:lipopolysaccharide export system protein LptA